MNCFHAIVTRHEDKSNLGRNSKGFEVRLTYPYFNLILEGSIVANVLATFAQSPLMMNGFVKATLEAD
uniref:Uncharacterized protein n=1 Tax=Vespula pensylvanica TaxID=30213 RepID=A0A834U899_VESPE|nr:hypothetical protein H0235_009444 [Vespula pensylvanica]